MMKKPGKSRLQKMTKNNMLLNELASVLMEASSVLIYPHVKVDGDGLGSSAAICCALRKLGKEAYVLLEDKVPDYLQFLDKDYCIHDPEILRNPDVALAVDCSDPTRFPERQESYERGKIKACVDHHAISQSLGDICIVDEKAAAAAELAYKLILSLHVELAPEMAEPLYTGILTDTGRFQYSNTTPETHRIAAELLEAGVDSNKIHTLIYSNVSLGKTRITARSLMDLKLLYGGQVALTRVTQAMLAETGAMMEETEGIVENLRSIDGVEVAAFLKEEGPEFTRVSFRAKTWANVGAVAAQFEGGGHVKAAGCSIYKSIDEAEALVIQALGGIFQE